MNDGTTQQPTPRLLANLGLNLETPTSSTASATIPKPAAPEERTPAATDPSAGATQEPRRANVPAASAPRTGIRKRFIFFLAGREFITDEGGSTALLTARRDAPGSMIEILVGIPNDDKSFQMWVSVGDVLYLRPAS